MSDRDEMLLRYLLGESPNDECARVEDEYFSSDEAFDRLEMAETALTDAYLAGELAPERASRYEQRYLRGVQDADRLLVARRLIAENAMPRASTQRWIRLVPAAAVLVLTASGVVLWRMGDSRELAESSHSRRPAPDIALPAVRTPLAFELSEGGTRSQGATRPLSITQEITDIELRTPPIGHNRGSTYRATISTPDGTVVYAAESALASPVEGERLRFLVPASRLQRGEYIVALAAIRDGSTDVIGEYQLMVVR